MKLAEVTYKGRVRHQQHVGASGETYRFLGRKAVGISDLTDIQQFQSKPNFEVEFTALGKLAEVAADESGDIRESINDMGYSAKQKLASHFDDVKGNAAEDELEAALEEKADRLQQQMEHHG